MVHLPRLATKGVKIDICAKYEAKYPLLTRIITVAIILIWREYVRVVAEAEEETRDGHRVCQHLHPVCLLEQRFVDPSSNQNWRMECRHPLGLWQRWWWWHRRRRRWRRGRMSFKWPEKRCTPLEERNLCARCAVCPKGHPDFSIGVDCVLWGRDVVRKVQLDVVCTKRATLRCVQLTLRVVSTTCADRVSAR